MKNTMKKLIKNTMKIPAANDLIHTITTNNIIDKRKVLDFIEQVTTNAEQVQKSVLSEILSRNAHVEYLQRHGLNGHTDSVTFKKILPVISYEDLKPDIDRIFANGIKTNSPPILCEQQNSRFFCSSGTSSGFRKRIPTTEEDTRRRWFLRSLVAPVVDQYMPGLDKGKIMFIMMADHQEKTTTGILISSSSAGFYRSSCFKEGFKNNPYSNYTSPIEAILCEDYYQSMYAQLLYGLYEHDQVLGIGALFGCGVVRTIKFLKENWTFICNDIRTGTTDYNRITDPLVQKAVMKLLNNKPNPELASFIEMECKRDESSWKSVISRLWPNAKFINTIMTGTMSQYIPTLDFYSNGLPIICPMYVGSECYMGINLNPLSKPDEVAYTLIPTMAYFEFLPVHDNHNRDYGSINRVEKQHDPHELVDLTDVKLGQEYEVVITTYTGLYRYRVGDVLRVSGFKNSAPQFNFSRRNNALLSVDTEITNEVELQNAVNIAEIHLKKFINASIVDYTSAADTQTTIPGHYVLYFELQCDMSCASIPRSVFEECCLEMEESLSSHYRDLRVHVESIGPLEIKIVKTGTFEKLMAYAVGKGASANQYKTPRSVKLAPIVELLNSRVVSNYLSQKCPRPVVSLGVGLP